MLAAPTQDARRSTDAIEATGIDKFYMDINAPTPLTEIRTAFMQCNHYFSDIYFSYLFLSISGTKTILILYSCYNKMVQVYFF